MASRKLSPGRFLVLGFAAVIIIGTILLLLPISVNDGVKVSPVDALFTSTSAVCVTGLIAIDTADSFNVFGRTVVALMIQIGGLGIASFGIMLIMLSGKKVGLREQLILQEALNLSNLKGIVRLLKSVILITLAFELVGMILSFIVFSRDYPFFQALGISAFHSVAAFNNSGFDILGGYRNLAPYKDDLLLNMTTCGLIIFGGLGFFVIQEIIQKRSLRKLCMNSKIVLSMTAILLIAGAVLFKLSSKISWLGAFFLSTSARTAGFSTYSVNDLSTAGQFILIILMFIGASPGSTGGGIKTTTTFVLLKTLFAFSTNRSCTAFKRKIPNDNIFKAFVVASLALIVVIIGTVLMCIFEPQFTFMQNFFEVVSACGTVGLSTGITPHLSDLSKLLLCLIMFIGRLGPITMACIWIYKPSSNLSYVEEKVIIG